MACKKYGTVWAHLHIGRARRGLPDVVSVKDGTEPVFYTSQLVLSDAVFCVRPAGRMATLSTGRKNVHAWVTGERTYGLFIASDGWQEVKYTPARGSFYVLDTDSDVARADWVWLAGTKVYAINPR